MLLRCAVENYLSICERQELSTIASSLRSDLDHVRPIDARGLEKHGYLPVLALYGANAAGKSNMLSGVNAIFEAVRTSYKRAIAQRNSENTVVPYRPPRFAKSMAASVSHFDVDVVLDEVRYHYGFETTAAGVHAEWLYSYPKGSKTVLFERKFQDGGTADFKFGRTIGALDGTMAELAKNRTFLFLSAARSVGTGPLKEISEKFASSLTFVMDESRFNELLVAEELAKSEQVLKSVEKFIALADVGIVGINVAKKVRTESLSRLMTGMSELLSGLFPEGNVNPIKEDAERREDWRIEFTHAGHNNETFIQEARSESSGTLSLLALLVPALAALESGRTFVVDELNNTLHTKLSEVLVQMFSDKRINTKGAQFIFSTHDTKLLNSNVFRRDEIWFAEKRSTGETVIYPLTDFSPRKQENIERSYLEGRYGAVPYFGDISAMFLP